MKCDVILFGLLLATGCGAHPSTPPGLGNVVATLPAGSVPLTMFGDDSTLHVMTGDLATDAGSQSIEFARIDVAAGSLENEALPANVDWTDFWEGHSLFLNPFLPNSIASGTTNEALVIGFRGLTTVPFDGSLSALWMRPSDVDSSGYVSSETIEDFELEADGSVTAVYGMADGIVAGSFSPEGVWTEIGKAYDTGWQTQVLSDANAVYFATQSSLWRVDRTSGASDVLYYLLANDLEIGLLTQTSDSIVMIVPTYADGVASGFELGKIPKTGGPLVPILSIDPTSPVIAGLAADDASIYVLSQDELDRISLASGSVDILAQRTPAAGGFAYLVLGATNVYWVDAHDPSAVVVRSVPK